MKLQGLKATKRPIVLVGVFFSFFGVIGVVSPFALGDKPRSTVVPPLSTVASSASSSVSEYHDGRPQSKRSRIRRFISNFNPSPNSKLDRNKWKGGEAKATVASRFLFSYVGPLLDLAQSRTLSEEDCLEVTDDFKMNTSVDSLADCYDHARSKSQKKIEQQRAKEGGDVYVKKSQTLLLFKTLLRYHRKTLLVTGILRLCNTLIQAFPAILIARILRAIEAGNEYPLSKGIWAAMSLVGVLTLKMVVENQFFHKVVLMATQSRGALEGLIFDKSLRLPDGGSGVLSKSDKDKEKKTLGYGGVLNLMEYDASKIEFAALQVHTVWDGPLQIAIYTSLLFNYLGPSVLWGIAVLLTTIPLNSITLRYLDRLSKKEDKAKEARTKRTSESIANMKLLKLQSWEGLFAEDIRKSRKDELDRHKTRGIVRAINSAISNAVPALVLVVTLLAYSKTGRPFVASTIFTAISLFNQLRFPLFFFPMLIDSIVNGKNALRRISNYLTSEELTEYVQRLPPASVDSGSSSKGGSIEMKSGNFLWSTSQTPKEGEVKPPEIPALCNVNLKVNPGEITAVVGNTGSGKSALVKGLLGELAPVPRQVVDQKTGADNLQRNVSLDRPSVTVHGNVAYCAQEAWLPKGTIRDAVVFGREYDEKRYLDAIYDAGLDKDMNPGGESTGTKAAAASGALSHETDVGEGGSSLSGGQRARVALARALYGGDDTKVFILDDCLAALDASVGSTVFSRLTKRFKDSNAAVVLVTNDPSIPRRCDNVILMGPTSSTKKSKSKCCTVVDTGSYDELLARGHNLQSFSKDDLEATSDGNDEDDENTNLPLPNRHGQHLKNDDAEHDHSEDAKVDMIRVVGGYKVKTNGTDFSCPPDRECREMDYMQTSPEFVADQLIQINGDETEQSEDTDIHFEKSESKTDSQNSLSPKRQSKQESVDDSMSTDAVPVSTYFGYLKAVRSPNLIIAMVAAFMTAAGAQLFQQFTVAKWTDLARNEAMAAALGGQYLRSLVYAAGVVSISLWLRSYLTMLVGARASTFYHNRLLSSVFRAPMSFFDATPSGQILSRFGKEMGTIDRALPDSFTSVLFCALQISSSAMALAGAITPAMLVPLGLAGSMYARTMRRFRPAARDMKRAEVKTRSPIFTHFGEALRGTETIRSIPDAAKSWSNQHKSLSDTNLSVYCTIKNLDRWLSCNLEALGNSMVFTTAIAAVILSRAGGLEPGFAGWGLTQATAITGLMAWAIRNLTMLESHMMSVQRVKEMTDIDSEQANLPTSSTTAVTGKYKMEREPSQPGEALKATFPENFGFNFTVAPFDETALIKYGWPWKGGVSFKNVSMRYNPSSPLVLKDVSIDVLPGTTLGVVGRTGSGKSSLLLTLFRICEIENNNGGSIEIDGVDIRSLSIERLRESLAIIAQDPVLFEGTVAYNLDASGKASQEEMWAALNAASPELVAKFKASGGLETEISEGGSNLSQGQRQLICLARALLRKSKILVLDEATSSVDPKTDQAVQETIKSQFVDKGVTVITVAHRLETVLGNDNIAVLGDGNLIEYGPPSELLKNPNGELRRLVDADRINKQKGSSRASKQISSASEEGPSTTILASS